MKATPLLLALALAVAPGGAAAPPAWSGDPAVGVRELEQQWAIVGNPRAVLGIRGVLRFALEANGLGWHPERVEAALARARALQDLDPESPTRGNFKWRSDQPGVVDRNAVEFATQLLGFMRVVQADRLSPGARRQADELLADAVAGLRNHVVRVDYTNIFVMKAWGLIAAGEALGLPEVAEDGYRRFEDWLRFTARNGIGEYGAVTYYGITLDSLVLIARWAGRPAARAKAELALRHLWTDAAANWWAPGDRLGGTNARTYDRLFGRGYFEAHTWTAGWLRARPELEGAGWLSSARDNLTTFRQAVTLVPPGEWTEAIRAEIPRMVVQRWGRDPEQRATNWVGRRVSLASSGASRGSDDRTLVANLGALPEVPQLSLTMDGRGDPYGTRRTLTASQHAKALHLTPFIATVQRGPEVLQLLSDDPASAAAGRRPGEIACLLSHFALPAQAEVWFGDRRAEPGRPEEPSLVPAGTAIFVRLEDAVIGLRVLLATTPAGGPAPVHFVGDRQPGAVRRLTVVHDPAKPSGRGTLVVFLRAADGIADAAFAQWRREFSAVQARAEIRGDVVTAEAAGEKAPLRIEADVRRGERRVIAGGEPDALLGVNGRDVGREVWAEFLQDAGLPP